MTDDPRPPTNGDRFTWKDWAIQRDYISRQIEAAVVGSEERQTASLMVVKNLGDEHGRQIGGLQQALMAAPDGDRPGGLVWQMGEMREDQKNGRRNVIMILGAIVAVAQFLAPYFQQALETVFKIPKP